MSLTYTVYFPIALVWPHVCVKYSSASSFLFSSPSRCPFPRLLFLVSSSTAIMVKPILKKRSPSEKKNSIDLNRPWEEQHVPGMAGLVSGYESAGPSRSARDVSFLLADNSASLGLGSMSGLGISTKSRYGHARSFSGASHISVATTASGGVVDGRPSAFVHPFSLQQTPRIQTSPMLDNADGNDEEHDDGEVGSLPTYHHHGHSHSQSHSRTASLSQSNSRHPTMVNQQAASFSDINAAAPPLRLNTNTSTNTTASTSTNTSTTPPSTSAGRSRRAGHRGSSISSSMSHSDLHLHMSTSAVDSPSLSTYDSHTPHSLRSSLDIAFPRMRSRSEVDTTTRADQIREARRKFEERERAKAEKHNREMLRKRERRDHKEARYTDRQQAAQLRKNSGTGSDVLRPSLSRKTTPTLDVASASASASAIALGEYEKGRDSGRYSRRLQPSASASASTSAAEKLAFKSSNYDHVPGGARPSFGPTVDNVAFRHAQRNNGQSAKRKTQGYWNGFVLWLRTRLFRMSKS